MDSSTPDVVIDLVSPDSSPVATRKVVPATANVKPDAASATRVIVEGSAKVICPSKVFYNKVQEFNRDISIAVLTAYSAIHAEKCLQPGEERRTKRGLKVPNNGLYVLEALAATGIRSVRYAKEVPGIESILANDIDPRAVDIIQRNIEFNNVGDIVTCSTQDAMLAMKGETRFDVIDIDPYGCPSMFLDSAVQGVENGGMLFVTATDMAVLAGHSPETCYSKYGSVSLRIKSCHEMALRILIHSIQNHANRHGRFVVPLLSVSVDYYIRVFVRVYSSSYRSKLTLSKLSMVQHCISCGSFELQPLGVVTDDGKKFNIPSSRGATRFYENCTHCRHSYHTGGPIWTGPLHNKSFVKSVLDAASTDLNTYRRINGVLQMVMEELSDVPLYYCIEKLSGTLHCEMPKLLVLMSAILNAGYRVSLSHCHRSGIKTDAPSRVIWDIMRVWLESHPITTKWFDVDPIAANILECHPLREYSFAFHPEANPASRRTRIMRFQENPTRFWGPGVRSTRTVAAALQNQVATTSGGQPTMDNANGTASTSNEAKKKKKKKKKRGTNSKEQGKKRIKLAAEQCNETIVVRDSDAD